MSVNDAIKRCGEKIGELLREKKKLKNENRELKDVIREFDNHITYLRRREFDLLLARDECRLDYLRLAWDKGIILSDSCEYHEMMELEKRNEQRQREKDSRLES